MPSPLKTPAQLQAQINRLKRENTHLRVLMRIILNTAYHAVNGEEPEEDKEEAHE